MDKGFDRCCDLIARMIEKYGDKMLQEIKKENAYQIHQWKTDNEGRKNRYVAYYKLVYKSGKKAAQKEQKYV